MTFQATAIAQWKTKPPGITADYQFTEVSGPDKESAIALAEKVNRRFGSGFAVVWDLIEVPEGEQTTRRVRMTETREEMSWEEFLKRYGVQVGLLRQDEKV